LKADGFARSWLRTRNPKAPAATRAGDGTDFELNQ